MPSLLIVILFLLIMCTDGPESTANSRSSGLVEVGAGIPFFNGSIKRSFVRIVELANNFAKSHAALRAYRSWIKVSHVIFPRISARKDYGHEAHTFG